MVGVMLNLGSQMHKYEKKRIEFAPPIPCDGCMGGMDAPWFVGSYIGETLAYVLCAACVVETSLFADTCSACIPDPSEDRTCDSCGKEYRRAPKKVVVEEPAEAPEPTPEVAVA